MQGKSILRFEFVSLMIIRYHLDMKYDIYLLHGWGGSKESLKGIEENLSTNDFSIKRLEMPGQGDTKEMNGSWSMKHYSMWLQTHINNENIQNTILIGHSFGGRIILESIIKQGLNPKAIVLIDVSGIKPRNSYKKLFWKALSIPYKALNLLIGEKLSEKIKRFVYFYIIRERDYVKTSGNLRKTFQIVNNAYYNDEIDKIDIPTLIIWGKDDTITPLWMGEYLHSRIRNSRFEILNGTHALPLKEPERVAQIIKDFINELK